MSDTNIPYDKLQKKLQKKKELSDYYFDNYNKFYEKKAFSKASEYLYGVLNNLVTAVALFYGHKKLNHEEIIGFVKKISAEKNLPELPKQMSAANSIHANFFHDWMSEEDFEISKNETMKLLETLKHILNELESQLH